MSPLAFPDVSAYTEATQQVGTIWRGERDQWHQTALDT